MAERRMFAKTIIDSDAFLDMPISTQALYFHLSMRADDDGFVNSPRKIMRMIGASEDEMKVLISKKFVISFDSGVIVIKHWRMHNYIRKDRYVETKYKVEKSMLSYDENSAYTTNGQPTVNQRLPQDRIGKVSIGKDNIHAERDDVDIKADNADINPINANTRRTGFDYQGIFDYYLSLDLIKHKSLNADMKKAMDKARKLYSFDEMKTLLKRHADLYAEKESTDYPIKKRGLAVFFGQKIYGGVSLICSEYADDGDKWLQHQDNTDTNGIRTQLNKLRIANPDYARAHTKFPDGFKCTASRWNELVQMDKDEFSRARL